MPYKHGALPVIGLIGGIGSGKSEVAALMNERGAIVIDADGVGHELLTDPRVSGLIADRFGAGVLVRAGDEPALPLAIDRPALGRIVFADRNARRDLEAILHPRMRAWFLAVIRETRSGGGARRYVVLDAAILLEAGWDDLCDLIVFVDAPRDERMRRVHTQRGWSLEQFEAREQAQWPCDQKRRRADLIITNDAGVDSLRRNVQRVETLLAEMSCLESETALS
jgi:dephospho-CoA kinase